MHHDLWDYDTSSAPQLTTIVKDGKRRDVVALAGKSGFLYVFDRVTGEPIWPIEERPVPISGMPGEKSWPTQPFPTVVPPFSKLNFTEDDINPFNNITPEEREAFREKVRGTKNLGMFTPIDFIDTMHLPGSNGGSVFGTAASEPGTGMVYVIGQNNPGILRLMRTGEPRNRFGGRGDARRGRLPAGLPELPRSEPRRHRQRALARRRDRAARRGGASLDGDRRQGPDAGVSAPHRCRDGRRC